MLHLRIISGISKGRTIPLDKTRLPLSIGRDADNTIALEHSAISRNHCRVLIDDGCYYIEDLGSTNGTFLNGRRIEREKLRPGDELIVANVGMVIEATSSASPYGTDGPMGVTVSIDARSHEDESLTLADPAESLGSEMFLEGFSSDRGSKSYKALQILYKADRAFRDIEDLKMLLENLLDLLMENVPASRGYIFLLQREDDELVPYVRRPYQPQSDDTELVVSNTILQSAVRRKVALISSDALVDERFSHSRSIVEAAVRSAMCVPLISRGQVLGICYMDSPRKNRFDKPDLALASAIALKAGAAVHNARLYEDLRQLFYNTVETLVRTIQAKDQYTSGHSTRVSRYALLIADKLGLTTKEKHQLYLASMLHDIGKIGVPDELLNHPGRLSREEMERVRSHVVLGASMLEKLGEMHPIVPLIRHHHEAWDGSGYPDGMKGEEIPLISRIVAVADMYDAMTSDRPYRTRRSHQVAVDEIKRVSGVKIDPNVASAFLAVLEELAPQEAHETEELPTT